MTKRYDENCLWYLNMNDIDKEFHKLVSSGSATKYIAIRVVCGDKVKDFTIDEFKELIFKIKEEEKK